MACYKISAINTPGSTLNLVIPKTSLTVKNGERACFKITTALPATTTAMPVYFQVGKGTAPLLDMLGNTLYSDQLMTGVCVPGVWGTNPKHFKLCSCVNGRSMSTSASIAV